MSARPKVPGTLTYVLPPMLAGSLLDRGPLRFCGRCLLSANEQGGIQLSPTRWCCAACWKSCTAGTRPQPKRLLKAA